MNERAFRLDFIIAIGALVVSILTMATLVYQTRVIEDQYSAAIWPYVELSTSSTKHSYDVALSNNGLGPALIRSAQLFVDGKPVRGWGEYESLIIGESKRYHGTENFSMSSLDRATTIRPNDTRQLLVVKLGDQIPSTEITRHAIALDVCYCSLNGRCWRLRDSSSTSPGNLPVPVAGCPSDAFISAGA